MERAITVRNAIESWRSGGVRRLLGGIGQRLVGAAPEPVEPARETQYGEAFWREPARPVVAPRKRRDLWLEQGELWREADDTHAEHVPAPRALEEPALTDPVSASRRATGFSLMAELPPDSTLSSTVRRARVPARRLDDVAKFLQVNGAVHGMRGEAELALPRGQFAARCALWRGARVGTPFLMGC